MKSYPPGTARDIFSSYLPNRNVYSVMYPETRRTISNWLKFVLKMPCLSLSWFHSWNIPLALPRCLSQGCSSKHCLLGQNIIKPICEVISVRDRPWNTNHGAKANVNCSLSERSKRLLWGGEIFSKRRSPTQALWFNGCCAESSNAFV